MRRNRHPSLRGKRLSVRASQWRKRRELVVVMRRRHVAATSSWAGEPHYRSRAAGSKAPRIARRKSGFSVDHRKVRRGRRGSPLACPHADKRENGLGTCNLGRGPYRRGLLCAGASERTECGPGIRRDSHHWHGDALGNWTCGRNLRPHRPDHLDYVVAAKPTGRVDGLA